MVTQFELRDKLAAEIMKMESFLDIETNPQGNSVILSKCTLDNKIYRAKISSNHGQTMVIDYFDYAEQIELEKKEDGTWVLLNDDDVTFTFFKYPLNLKHYPIMTFGIKIHG